MLYVGDAAAILNVSVPKAKQLIADRKLGSVCYGMKNTVAGLRPQHKVTGWQLIDFIEQLQAGEVQM